MFGLAVVGVFFMYLLLCAGVVWWAVKAARKRGIKGWKWGVPAALFMYLIVFWDHIPTLLLHHYYCATKAGYWVYKTPEQWKEENPRVAETLTWQDNSPSLHNERVDNGLKLNERINYEQQFWKAPILPVRITTAFIVDSKTGEILVKQISISSGYGNFSGDSSEGDWRVIKFWVGANLCIRGNNGKLFSVIPYKEIGRKVQ